MIATSSEALASSMADKIADNEILIPSTKIHVIHGIFHPSAKLTLYCNKIEEGGMIFPSLALYLPGREDSFDIGLSGVLAPALSCKLDFLAEIFPALQTEKPSHVRHSETESMIMGRILFRNLRTVRFDVKELRRGDNYYATGKCHLILKNGGTCDHIFYSFDGQGDHKDEALALPTFFSKLPPVSQ